MNHPGAPIGELHTLYVRETGLEIRLDMERERQWFEWRRKGFTADDLRLVIAWLKVGIRHRERRPGALKFHNLIVNNDYFEEDLAQARKERRPAAPRPDPNRAAALRASGRDPADPAATAKTAAQIIAGYDALKKAISPPKP